jgi:Smg protein
MEGLTRDRTPTTLQAERSSRLFSSREMERLDTECRGFILFLEQMGVLSPDARELAIDRAMALESEDFDLDQMKWVVMMVLFNQPGEEAAYAWVEDLVFDSSARNLH